MESVDDTPGIEAKLRHLQSTLASAGLGEPVRRIETHTARALRCRPCALGMHRAGRLRQRVAVATFGGWPARSIRSSSNRAFGPCSSRHDGDIETPLTLEPGDVIATGTPAGIGAFRKPPVWLQPGDRIRMEISRIGVLEHQIAG